MSTPARHSSKDAVARHFEREFTALQEGDLDLDANDLLEYFFVSRTGIDPRPIPPGVSPYPTDPAGLPEGYEPDTSFVRGKIVLDAGCGPGRFTRVAAEAGASLVVGLDIADHLDRAARRCRDLPNVAFVRGSVTAPPFKEGIFDFVFSIGVIHHTADPEGCVFALSRGVASEGALSVWVYPPGYWGGRFRGLLNRSVHRWLRTKSPAAAWRACERYLYPLGRVQMFFARRRWSKILFAPLFLISVPRHPNPAVMRTTIFDYFATPVISTHSPEEVAGWLRRTGMTELRPLGLPSGWFASRRPLG